MQPKFVLTTRSSGSDYRSAVNFALTNQFDGLDWNLDYYRVPAASNARKAFVDVALGSGLPSRFHAPCQDIELGHADPRVSETALLYLKMYIDFLKVFPETHLNLHIGSRSIPEAELSWDTAVRNLTELVAYGKAQGVTVCLENLKQGWTSVPEKLAYLAEASGAMVTLDIGHARGCLKITQSDVKLEDYIAPYAARIRNVHLYEIETVEGRHIEPENLEGIGSILDRLLEYGVSWWVIELNNFPEMARVKDLLIAKYR
ncbi:MAG TPA: TIM barrel protein [Bacillota bacterium]|nr:TIM barrel protein [Bacillota bacterium]